MKKIALFLLFILITSFAFSQDIIITREGKKIESKVLEINENDIRYKSFENLDGPIYTMRKSDIATIMYANGQVDVFNMNVHTAPTPQPIPSNTIFRTKADYDNARKLRNAGIGCFAGGIMLCITGSVIAGTSYHYDYYGWYHSPVQAAVGSALATIGSLTTIAGIVMWPVGQTRMNRIRRLNPNGFSLFENEKMQLNLAIDGNVTGFKLNF